MTLNHRIHHSHPTTMVQQIPHRYHGGPPAFGGSYTGWVRHYAHLKEYRPHCSIYTRYADAVTQHSDGKRYFAEPHYQKMTMRSLLSKLGSSGRAFEWDLEHWLMSSPQGGTIWRISVISSRKMVICSRPVILPLQTQRTTVNWSV